MPMDASRGDSPNRQMTAPRAHSRFQDHVIRDGKPVGQFEELHRDFDDPREQTVHTAGEQDQAVELELLSKYGQRRVLEYCLTPWSLHRAPSPPNRCPTRAGDEAR